MDGQTDGRTDGQIPPVFYRTSSPSGPLPKKQKSNKRTDMMLCKVRNEKATTFSLNFTVRYKRESMSQTNKQTNKMLLKVDSGNVAAMEFNKGNMCQTNEPT